MDPYGMCQTGCNAVTMACYASAGVVFGAGSVPACSAAQGTCMTACAGATAAAAAGGVATGAVTGATVAATILNPVTLASVAAVPVGRMLWKIGNLKRRILLPSVKT
ncbi:hypothetical protein FOCC_FOCC002806 [Frankliniella occidentalis]|nr:hypothetical protein FOCC_FOCC002806 [Frankliniella occidentalis]